MNGSLPMTVKSISDGDGPGEFEAILSTPQQDRDGETIKAGAFLPLRESIPVYHQHDWKAGALPIAKATPYYDGELLMVKGVFASTARGQEMRALVSEGIVDSMSVGFIKTQSRGSIISKGQIIEGSFTGIPINTGARVLSAKAMEVKSVMDGSYEDLAEDLQEALIDLNEGVPYLQVRGTFPDHVVYDVYDGDDMTTTTYSVDYSETSADENVDDASRFTFGVPVEVDVEEVVVASESDKSMTADDPAAVTAAPSGTAATTAGSDGDDGHNQLLARSLEHLAAAI